jgi:hypothetical protein
MAVVEPTVSTILLGSVAGLAATATMDVLASLSRRVGLTVGAKGLWVGRWYLGLVRGRFVHADISLAPEHPGERRTALVGHYAIGVVLAVLYVVGAGWLGLAADDLRVALVYGLATCAFPWFLLFPALGFGCFGRRAPAELRVLRSSVVNHLGYGLGLWWIANVLPLG